MANPNYAITSTIIRYLLAMRDLSIDKDAIRVTDIADALNVSKPSVHAMTKTLKLINYISKDRYGAIYLTEQGKNAAKAYGKYFDLAINKLGELLPESVNKYNALANLISEIPQEMIESVSEAK